MNGFSSIHVYHVGPVSMLVFLCLFFRLSHESRLVASAGNVGCTEEQGAQCWTHVGSFPHLL